METAGVKQGLTAEFNILNTCSGFRSTAIIPRRFGQNWVFRSRREWAIEIAAGALLSGKLALLLQLAGFHLL